jgi:hypothetical protein
MRSAIAWLAVVGWMAGMLAGCAPAPGLSPSPTPGPEQPVGTVTLPLAQVIFNLIPPQGTASEAEVSVIVLDEVTGAPYNPTVIPMRRLQDGRWQAQTTASVGSLLKYRYVRRSPGNAEEATPFGSPVAFRAAHVAGPTQINDIAAAWTDLPFAGTAGRVLGQLTDAESGQALGEMIVSLAGLHAFTAGDGTFRFDGVPPGKHLLVAFSPDGSYHTFQQEAVVAPESTTPANLALRPARQVQVAFEVTVPADTPPGAPVRMAGSLRSFGHLFGEQTGGVTNAPSLMPILTQVDPTHYILVTSLYAGSDLRYKYTLGDGLWNAERTTDGTFLTRQLVVPDEDLILRDAVATWQGSASAALHFTVTVPDTTLPEDSLGIQFNPFVWFEPLPMWQSGPSEWFYSLSGPLDFTGSLGYRFCRNQACGSADDVETAGSDAIGLRVTPTLTEQDLRHTVRAWQWWTGPLRDTNVLAPEISPRPGFEAGVEMTPAFRPVWIPRLPADLAAIESMGSNAVILSPAWTLGQNSPLPSLAFDPRYGPYAADLASAIRAGHQAGMRVVLHPSLRAAGEDWGRWWSGAPRSEDWWTVWFEHYRAFLLTYARLAAEQAVEKLVVGGPEIAPALPGGLLPSGSPAGVPVDAEARWRSMLAEVRRVYPGRLAFEIELGSELQTPPAFLDLVDEVHIYWHAPLGTTSTPTVEEMQVETRRLLQEVVLSAPGLTGRPVVLSVEYPSVDGGATGCPPSGDGSCLRAQDFELGQDPNPALALDLDEQVAALNAVLAEVIAQPAVTGFYVRGYNPLVALQDKSASVHGKPAAALLEYWYSRLTGR